MKFLAILLTFGAAESEDPIDFLDHLVEESSDMIGKWPCYLASAESWKNKSWVPSSNGTCEVPCVVFFVLNSRPLVSLLLMLNE